MLKPQPQVRPTRAVHLLRPFPLYRLPSLLKRSLSISASSSTASRIHEDLKRDEFSSVDSSSSTSSSSSPRATEQQSHVLLQILPNFKQSRLAWVTTRLLCQSLSYIAGISFYDFVASLLSLSHNEMKIYDVLSSSSSSSTHRIHSTKKLYDAWFVTICLGLFVIIVVTTVVKLSEKKFAFQIHRENEQIEFIEAQLLRRQNEAKWQVQKDEEDAEEASKAEPEAEDKAGFEQCEEKTAVHIHSTPARTSTSLRKISPINLPSADTPSSIHAKKNSLPEVVAEDQEEEDEEEETVAEKNERARRQQEQAALLIRHPALAAKIKAEEDKRAVTRAMIHNSLAEEDEDDEEEEEEEEEDAERDAQENEALNRAIEKGLTPRQIARRAVKNQTQRRQQQLIDPIQQISPTTLFFYRLIDLFAFYAVFIAVYAFQNTLQLTFDADTCEFSWLYFIMLMAVSFTVVRLLEIRSDELHHQLVVKQAQELDERRRNAILKHRILPQSAPAAVKTEPEVFSFHSAPSSPVSSSSSFAALAPLESYQTNSSFAASATTDTSSPTGRHSSSAVRKLRVQQATHRKLSSYICSCLAYLLAYAAWNAMQSTSLLVIPETYAPVMTSRLYLWFSAACVLATSGLIIVGFNWRVRLALLGDDLISSSSSSSSASGSNQSMLTQVFQPLDLGTSLLRLCCCSPLLNRFISREQASTEKLAAHLDNVLEGNVTSFTQQCVSEALSYIIALSLGAALSTCLSAAPSDAAIFTGKQQPTASAIIAYAITCSATLALCTMLLEKFVKRQELRSRQRTQRLLDAHSRAVLEQQRLVNGSSSSSSSAVLNINQNEKNGSTSSPFSTPSQANHAFSGPAVQCLLSNGREKFRSDTPETAIYVWKRQQEAEQALRAQSNEEEYFKREEKRKQRNALQLLTSPSPKSMNEENAAEGKTSFLALPSSANSPSLPSSSSNPSFYGSFSENNLNHSNSQIQSPNLSFEIPRRAQSEDTSTKSHAYQSSNVLNESTRLLPALINDVSGTHRAILTLSFLEQYYSALASTLTQGFALLVAYSWVSVFSLVLFPALRRWSLLWLVDDWEIKGVWSIVTFLTYFLSIFLSARYFHKAEFYEL